MKTHKTIPFLKYARIVLPILILLTLWFLRAPLKPVFNLLKDQEAISSKLQRLGAFGPLVLFGLLVAQVFLATIPGHALMMAGGYVFGPGVAIAVTASSTILGSQIAFSVARRFGRQIVHRLAKPKDIKKWDHLADRQGALFFFFAFVLPIFPSDLMCYAAGLGKVSPRKFLAANIAGRSICAVAITMIGVYGFRPPWQFWAAVLGGTALLFCWWWAYKRWTSRPIGVQHPAHRMSSASLRKPLQSCFRAAIRTCKILGGKGASQVHRPIFVRRNIHENEPV